MNTRTNTRGQEYQEAEKQHLKLNDLKVKEGVDGGHKYLFREKIPASPQPEFHVSHLRHDTDQKGLRGIRSDEGFKNSGEGSLLWWSLHVEPDEMESAEKRLLENTFPDRTEEQAWMQPSFLGKFATSPAFLRTSRMGSYRFTFPVEELLKAYSDQFCSGEPPVMKVYATHLYPQQVIYVVLVHSPDNQEEFSDYRELPADNTVCTYKEGYFSWRPEAMSASHYFKLVLKHDENQMEAQPAGHPKYPEYYVWDHVAVVLDVKNQVLKFDAGRLRENLKFCSAEKSGVKLPGATFEDFKKAQGIVKKLWSDNDSPLKEDKEKN